VQAALLSCPSLHRHLCSGFSQTVSDNSTVKKGPKVRGRRLWCSCMSSLKGLKTLRYVYCISELFQFDELKYLNTVNITATVSHVQDLRKVSFIAVFHVWSFHILFCGRPFITEVIKWSFLQWYLNTDECQL
jgi:hypothetical protein